MFDNPDNLANPYYSYINDTIYYYLTWEVSPTQKKRLIIETDTSFSNYQKLDYCIKDIVNQYNSSYYYAASDPRYTEGEGWFDSQVFVQGSNITKTVSVQGYTANNPVNIKAVVVGAPATQIYSSLNHELKITISGTDLLIPTTQDIKL